MQRSEKFSVFLVWLSLILFSVLAIINPWLIYLIKAEKMLFQDIPVWIKLMELVFIFTTILATMEYFETETDKMTDMTNNRTKSYLFSLSFMTGLLLALVLLFFTTFIFVVSLVMMIFILNGLKNGYEF